MKRIWKRRRDDEAVSPVIATILMVAITVVLAAVLYVMVLGFTPGDEGGSVIISFSKGSTTDNWTFSVASISGGPLLLGDCRAIVKDAAGDVTLSTAVSSINGTWSAGVRYTDANSDGKLTAADYFSLDKSTYALGSTLQLTDLAGSKIFATVSV